MAGIKIKRNVKVTWTRRLMISVINFLRRGRYSRIIVFGAAAAVIFAVVLVIVLTGSGSNVKTVSNTDPIPSFSGAPTTTPIPTITPTPIPTTTPPPDVTLKYGDENKKVQALQERLMDLGYLDIDEPTQKFGPATKIAVEWVQRQAGLKQTGIADAETQEWLNSGDAQHYTLKKGTKGTDVDALQRQLISLGYLNKNSATGNYGDATTAAVKDFQKRNRLKADGKTGEKTLALIYSPKAKVSASKAAEKRTKANINQMIAIAEKQIGKPYVSGAEGPNSFDCSGLVYYCLKQAGSSRGRYNAQGYSVVTDWKKISSYKDLVRGDLMFFHIASRNKAIGHVAIYIGNGMVIDASSGNGRVVKRSCMGNWFKSCFRFARRPWSY